GKLIKAEEIADIAMTNMPVDKFGYYTLLEPYIGAYYEVGAKAKAQQLFIAVAEKYQENLKYYSELTRENQEKNIVEIYTDIERYNALIKTIVKHDESFADKEFSIFNNYIKLFAGLYGIEEQVETALPDERDIISRDSSIPGLDSIKLPE